MGSSWCCAAGTVFNLVYDNNLLKLQNGVDWVGQQINHGLKTVYETTSNLVEDVGAANNFKFCRTHLE